jgi:hypothetical protein
MSAINHTYDKLKKLEVTASDTDTYDMIWLAGHEGDLKLENGFHAWKRCEK